MPPLSQSPTEITGSPWPLCTSSMHVAACSVSEPNWECLDEGKENSATHSAFRTRSRIFSVFKAPDASAIQGTVPPNPRLTICREFLKGQATQHMTIALGIRAAQLILEFVILVRRTSDLFPPPLPHLSFFRGLPPHGRGHGRDSRGRAPDLLAVPRGRGGMPAAGRWGAAVGDESRRR